MRAGFLRRRIVIPILDLLRQGITPEKIALSIALGITLGVTPVLGSTSILCFLAAARSQPDLADLLKNLLEIQRHYPIPVTNRGTCIDQPLQRKRFLFTMEERNGVFARTT